LIRSLRIPQDAEAKGATLTSAYKREGNLIHPLVIDHVTEEMKIHWEEPFGPVLPFVRVASAEEAVALANKSTMGLQGCVFTQDINRAILIANELCSGTVQINGPPARYVRACVRFFVGWLAWWVVWWVVWF